MNDAILQKLAETKCAAIRLKDAFDKEALSPSTKNLLKNYLKWMAIGGGIGGGVSGASALLKKEPWSNALRQTIMGALLGSAAGGSARGAKHILSSLKGMTEKLSPGGEREMEALEKRITSRTEEKAKDQEARGASKTHIKSIKDPEAVKKLIKRVKEDKARQEEVAGKKERTPIGKAYDFYTKEWGTKESPIASEKEMRGRINPYLETILYGAPVSKKTPKLKASPSAKGPGEDIRVMDRVTEPGKKSLSDTASDLLPPAKFGPKGTSPPPSTSAAWQRLGGIRGVWNSVKGVGKEVAPEILGSRSKGTDIEWFGGREPGDLPVLGEKPPGLRLLEAAGLKREHPLSRIKDAPGFVGRNATLSQGKAPTWAELAAAPIYAAEHPVMSRLFRLLGWAHKPPSSKGSKTYRAARMLLPLPTEGTYGSIAETRRQLHELGLPRGESALTLKE